MKLKVQIAGLLLTALVIGSCSSQPETKKPLPPSMYEGMGKDLNNVSAIRIAKRDAIRNAVLDLVGPTQENFFKERIAQQIYNVSDPNLFLFPEEVQAVSREKEGEMTVVKLRVKVDMQSLSFALQTAGINPGPGATVASGNGSTGNPGTSGSTGANTSARPSNAFRDRAQELITGVNPGATATPAATTGTSTTSTATTGTTLTAATEEDWGKPTPEEASFLRRYVDTMTYMVYFGDNSTEDPAVLAGAVNIANRFFTQRTMEVVDMAVVDKLKKEQQTIWEESTGGDVSFLQWIAQRLNADVYVELDVVTDAARASGGYNGSVNLVMKLFDPSTGRLLGSRSMNSDRSFSRVSEFDAVTNAIQSSVFALLPIAVNDARAYMEKALVRGIRYDLVLQQTTDARLLAQFRRQLQNMVKSVEVSVQEAGEARYTVFYVGSASDLEETIYRAAQRVPGLENMYNVMIRGKSLTFHTGL